MKPPGTCCPLKKPESRVGRAQPPTRAPNMSGTDRETRPLATRSLIEQIFRAIHSLLPGQAQGVGPGPILYPDRTLDQEGQSYSGFRDHVGKPPFSTGRFEVGALDRTLVRKVNA